MLGFYAVTYNWTAIEAGIGLVCACFPVITPLFKAKSFQQHYKIVFQKLGSSRSGSAGSFRWFTSHGGKSSEASRNSQDTLHEKQPAFSHCPNCGYSLDAKVQVPSPPPATRIRDSFQERREILHPGLGDPRVVNEVYRGVDPGNMGLDKDGKPLPMTGIKVRTHIESVRSPSLAHQLDFNRCDKADSNFSAV